MIKECFKNKDFRILWGAGCMTGIARAMEFLALSLYALQELGIPYLVTVIFAARMLPMSLLGIVIGTISERVSPILIIKNIYILSNIFTGMAVILVFTDNFNMLFALILAFVNGITWVVDLAVRRRVLADNIKKKLLSSSLAMETLSNNATRLIGPIFAGTLYTLIGLTGIFSLQFIMYLLALGLIITFKNNTNKDIILNSPQKIPLAIKEHWAHGLLDEILKTGKSVYSLVSLRMVLITTLIFNIFGFPSTCFRNNSRISSIFSVSEVASTELKISSGELHNLPFNDSNLNVGEVKIPTFSSASNRIACNFFSAVPS